MAASGFTPDGNPATVYEGLVIKTILTHSDTSLHAASIHFRGGRFALHINLHQGAIGRDMLYLYLGIGWPLCYLRTCGIVLRLLSTARGICTPTPWE